MPGGGQTLWHWHQHCDRLGAALSRDGQRSTRSNGWAQAAGDLRWPPGMACRTLPRERLPIEKLFAKIKHRLRQAQARTPDAIDDALAAILQTVSPNECRNYFKEAGYERM